MVEATLKLLDFAVNKKKFRADYFVLLSGQDYPLKSNKEIFGFFEKNKGKEFIDTKFHKRYVDRITKRYLVRTARRPEHYPSPKYYFELAEAVFRVLASRAINYRLKNKGVIENLRECGFKELCGGSQFWAITKPLAKYILEFVNSHKAFKENFKNCFASDEFFFQLIVANSNFKDRISKNLHHISWATLKPHPKLMILEDEEELKSSKMLFARKFDETNTESRKVMESVDKERAKNDLHKKV